MVGSFFKLNYYYIDTLFNHMAGIDSGTGTAGSTFTHYNYPGIYQDSVGCRPCILLDGHLTENLMSRTFIIVDSSLTTRSSITLVELRSRRANLITSLSEYDGMYNLTCMDNPNCGC